VENSDSEKIPVSKIPRPSWEHRKNVTAGLKRTLYNKNCRTISRTIIDFAAQP
jgi:hypothetical protein